MAARQRKGGRIRVTSRGGVTAPAKKDIAAARKRLRGSVLRYDRPTDPVIDPKEWDANR